jgi:two-component system phosphate regulon sensor histidine kinase PhoR
LRRPAHLVALAVLAAGAAALMLDRAANGLIADAIAERAPASLRERLVLSVILFAAVLLVAIAGSWMLHRIRRPLRAIARAADAVASGRQDLAIEPAGGELDRLAVSLDRMRRALVDQIGQAESERRLLASVLAGLHEGIVVVNPERRVLILNEALRRILDVRRDIADGSRLIDAVWDHTVLSAFDEALTNRTEVRRQIHLPRGRSFDLMVSCFSDASGRHAGAIGLLFDVTRLEALEKVRRDFVADISHELRTPLASVKAAVETLVGGAAQKPEDLSKFLGIIAKNSSRMEAILSDLTDLSMIETGAIPLVFTMVDLGAVAREVIESLAPRASKRQVKVTLDIPAGTGLRADRRRFEQILVNLLDNAIKFSPVGGTITMGARTEGDRLRLVVEDEGPGIPPDALERIFNRFFQVDRARARQVPGTGLGLAIVKHLVQRHAGEIRAENRPDGGTRFLLDMPLAGPES